MWISTLGPRPGIPKPLGGRAGMAMSWRKAVSGEGVRDRGPLRSRAAGLPVRGRLVLVLHVKNPNGISDHVSPVVLDTCAATYLAAVLVSAAAASGWTTRGAGCPRAAARLDTCGARSASTRPHRSSSGATSAATSWRERLRPGLDPLDSTITHRQHSEHGDYVFKAEHGRRHLT